MGIDFSRVYDKYADRKRVVIDVLPDKTIVWAPSGLEILKKMHESDLLDTTLFGDFNILIFESLASELMKVKSGIYGYPVYASAALKFDGTVVAWGHAHAGGDATGVDLSNVVRVFSTSYAFAALKSDQTVVAWGGENDIDMVRQLAEDSI